MSYNIDHIETLVLDAYMRAKDVVRLYKKYEGDLCEDNFLSELFAPAQAACTAGDSEYALKITTLTWRGAWSGSSYKDVFLKNIAPHIKGVVEAVITWEGGDSVSGLLIKDGKAAEVEVEYQLKKPDGWDDEATAVQPTQR